MKKPNLKLFNLAFILLYLFLSNSYSQQIHINGPVGSELFGAAVSVLPNGNIVVRDPLYDIPNGASNVGAVYLYNGATGELISMLTGSTANDQVGNGGIRILFNGNYVIISTIWDGTATDVGAVTFANGTNGVAGVVSADNSLVGSSTNDNIGISGITTLPNGNYVVNSQFWDGQATDVGAVTFGNGTTGITGVVSASNSLVGSTASDRIGLGFVTVLTNSNYVVNSRFWDGTAVNVGAITFGDGTTGVSGFVSSSNSLVGSTAEDRVGDVTPLTNGNYVVTSSNWDGTAIDVGAVTWGNGTIGTSGVVSASNSLVGSKFEDAIGIGGVTALSNGNYVVKSPYWNSTSFDVGAATFGNGTTGITGVVSSSNSLVGLVQDDQVGGSVTALTNGNYVVSSARWNHAQVDVGAATFGNGTTGITGLISSSNSLIGSRANDNVGISVTPLSNGNYVIGSPNWDGQATDVGAITFGNGTSGITGVVSNSNSLVGSTAGDFVGNSIRALTNGNYVVINPNWDGTAIDVGAVTLGNGTTGINGVVSASNSLVGSTTGDLVDSYIMPLTNSNYVVSIPNWDGMAVNVGAATFGNGNTGVSGIISASNSLVGSTANDNVGNIVSFLRNGNYVVSSPNWDGSAINVGAVTWGNGETGSTGFITASNSLVGSTGGDQIGIFGVASLPNGDYMLKSQYYDKGAIVDAGAITYVSGKVENNTPILKSNSESFNQNTNNSDLTVNMFNSVIGTTPNGGASMNFVYDSINNQIIVGRPTDNIVTLFNPFAPINVSVSGRVLNARNLPIAHAFVNVTDKKGQTRTVRTNIFGNYRFENLQYGETYTFDVRAKGYIFISQMRTVDDNISGFDFIEQ